jgi:hypothetical protein
MGSLNVHTQELSGGTITIVSSDHAVRVSIICSSGTITVNGSSTFQSVPSGPVTFEPGEGITVTSPALNNPIDGLTVDATGGVADLVISTQ